MKVAVAFDHRGVHLRDVVLGELDALGHEPLDLGTDTDAVRIDYPDKAREIGEAVLGKAERGILVCGSGVGASIAASKIAGIRAATCHDTYSAHQGVEHDDMNVLCLGSGVIGPSLAAELVRAFLGAEFDGGEPYAGQRDGLTWLPTLDQLRSMMLAAFSTTGCFTSSFNGRAWWFAGNILGMTVTNLVPLAEGGSAEEAAINALLMRHQR